MPRPLSPSLAVLAATGLVCLLIASLTVIAAVKCPKCGKPVEASWKFCKYCGAKLTHESNELPPKPGQTKINPKDGAEMVWITAGEFLMGSDEYDAEKPPHKVYLDGYWIYKNDVTVAQYRKFCEATGRQMPPTPPWGWKDDHPIVSVSWEDAKAYCDWAGVALPTEAQWEKAARGVDGREYPWGNQWDAGKCANSVNNKLSGTKAVGTYPEGASPFGVLDMAGNVWQWCADWYDANYYKNSPSRNPTGPDSGQYRVIRGDSWFSYFHEYSFRCADRSVCSPGDRNYGNGFRCVQGP